MADPADNRVNLTSSRYSEFCARNPALPHQPISQQDPTRLDHTNDDNNIPAAASSASNAERYMVNMNCCCGRPDCAYLEHNNTALGGLEKDLETAARLGQALLDRHEAYVKESQAEQARLSSYVQDLESEKASLQDANHRVVAENRELLQKLEQLNTEFAESGARVHDLEHLLQDCEHEIRRLNGLTRMTQELELRVLDMEKERAELTKDVEDGRDENRSTITRWKESERKVRQLEQEVQKIERATRVDRERHEEIVARIERDRALERELGLSEGRLKATAAIQTMEKGGTQKQVVSNFVRDILQDNANLQVGIAELRDLLQSSNTEVESLREQIMLHQPVHDDGPSLSHRTLSLSDELDLTHSPPQKQVQQEVHVHHHYHTKMGAKRERTPVRKTLRRRAAMPSGAVYSSASSSGASTPLVGPQRHASSAAVQLRVQPAQSTTNRWSVQSAATTSTYQSSMTSSPRSYYDRNSSIFDRIEREEESSRPTSPDSSGLSSPTPFKRRTRGDNNTLDVFEEEGPDLDNDVFLLEEVMSEDPTTVQIESEDVASDENLDGHEEAGPGLEVTPKPSMNLEGERAETAAVEEPSTPRIPDPPPPPDLVSKDQVLELDSAASLVLVESRERDRTPPPTVQKRSTQANKAGDMYIGPRVRRSNSHDSLFSLSGMDIHLAQQSSRSTLALLYGHGANKHHFAPSPSTTRLVPGSTSKPLATVTEYTATSRPGLDPMPSASLLALNGIRSQTTRSSQAQPQSRGLMGSVGGWMSSKWGRAPTSMKSVADLRSAVVDSSKSPPPRPSASHSAALPIVVNSSAASIAPSTTSKLTVSSGKRNASTNALDVPISARSDEASLSGSLSASMFLGRTPGINQTGPIPGFAAVIAGKRTPTVVEAPKVDLDNLEESLTER